MQVVGARCGTFAGETFCAGSGTRIRIPDNDAIIEVDLASLASGDGCAVTRAGRVQGCVRF